MKDIAMVNSIWVSVGSGSEEISTMSIEQKLRLTNYWLALNA